MQVGLFVKIHRIKGYGLCSIARKHRLPEILEAVVMNVQVSH